MFNMFHASQVLHSDYIVQSDNTNLCSTKVKEDGISLLRFRKDVLSLPVVTMGVANTDQYSVHLAVMGWYSIAEQVF